MQSAHSSSNCVGLPFGWVVVVVPPPWWLPEVPAGRLATVGELVPRLAGGELELLHAASAMGSVARRATREPHPRYLDFLSRRRAAALRAAQSGLHERSPIRFICFISTVEARLRQLYETEGHSPVTVVTSL
jgi:hypothetical protein